MRSKLAICYRVYPGISKIPAIFKEDKLKLTEFALKSFVNALDNSNLDIKIWVILDNCNQNYNQIFQKYLPNYNYELINVPKSGNAATFGMQMNILRQQNFSENIYFAEDDYFYLPNAFKETINILENNIADFVTPYDHPDIYNLKFHNYKKETIKLNNSNYKWINCATTTMTFMTTKKNLIKYWKYFKSYTKLNYDTSMWLSITKYNIRNPFKILSDCINSIHYLKIYSKVFYFFPFSFLGSGAKLLCPKPSLATHLDNQGIPDSVDWNEEFIKISDGI